MAQATSRVEADKLRWSQFRDLARWRKRRDRRKRRLRWHHDFFRACPPGYCRYEATGGPSGSPHRCA